MWVGLVAEPNFWLDLAVSKNSWIKISIFLVAWAIIWLPIAIPLAWWLKLKPFQSLMTEQKFPLIISLYLLAPLIVWKTLQIEEKSIADYGLAFNPTLWLYLFLGIGIGISTLAVIFLVEWLLGWINWHSENYQKLWTVVFPLLGLALGIGGIEEIIFRGLFFNQLQEDYSILIAATISSSIFALSHLVWERKSTLPQLPGLWLMGMVLVVARLEAGGSLGLAWGLHAGWVWAIASLDTARLISYTGKGPAILTGLGGQPLAGVAGIICMIITAIILWRIGSGFLG